MKKISNIILILLTSIMLSGCGTLLLFTGTVIGGAYVANDIEKNYDGDGGEFIKDKSNKAYKAVTEE